MGWMGGKSAAPPPPPDYMALAKQQAADQNALLDKQTMENRANQVTPEGTLTWSKDPTTGVWTQTTKYTPEAEAARQAQQRVQAGLSNTAEGMLGSAQGAVSQPFSYDGMTNVSGYDPSQVQGWGAMPGQGNVDWQNVDTSDLQGYGSIDPNEAGFGSVEAIRDAMMGRLQPGLTQGREQEIQRLKAQGITEGTPAWQAAMRSLNQKDVDASQQALLGGAQEYGNIWNRKLQAANFSNALRGQQVSERTGLADFANNLRGQQFGEQQAQSNYANALRGMQIGEQGLLRDASTQDRNRQIEEAIRLRQMPLNELNAFMSGGQVQGPQFNSYNTASAGTAADIYGAAKDDYKTQMDAYNAAQAKKGGMLSGALGLVGAGAGAFFGGPMGAQLGASLGGGLGGMMGG